MKQIKKALWWEYQKDEKIKCLLCPRYCVLSDGEQGFCFVRQNRNNELVTISYGYPTGFGFDPIEKKPLFHFLPGSEILSFGTIGCNMGCSFCQNWSTSKSHEELREKDFITAEDIVHFAVKRKIPSIAYTYNEPNIFGEFVIDVSESARNQGVKNVMVTAGYINPKPREEVYRFIDAANVDLKGITASFYRKNCLAEIEPVLDTLKWIKNKTNIWLELTTLLIPGENDSENDIKNLARWIYNELGSNTPLHFTGFHPDYKMTDKPRTSATTLGRAKDIAEDEGLAYVYLGNVHSKEGQTTCCPGCGAELIQRDWHAIIFNRLVNGCCYKCNRKIDGVFTQE